MKESASQGNSCESRRSRLSNWRYGFAELMTQFLSFDERNAERFEKNSKGSSVEPAISFASATSEPA